MEDDDMIRIRKLILAFLLISICLLPHYPRTLALETNSIPIIKEIDVPQELDFSVSKICSKHTYFMQAAANTSGCFLVYSRHMNPDNYSDLNFKKAYIDVYHSDGKFWQELSFTTPFDLAVAFEENVIVIYFYNSVLTYDLTTQETHCYATPEGAAINNGLYKQLRSQKFIVGKWTYRCKKTAGNYVKLVRSDGTQEQILIDMAGMFPFLKGAILPAGASGIGMIIIVIWQHKRKQNRK